MDTSICEGVYWVGCVDWTVRDFHGFNTERGATYNSYLVCDEKVALIDTVKEPFAQELLGKVAAHVELGKIDFVICNHAEPDHAGALARVMAAMPNAKLVCNRKCQASLARHFDTSQWAFHLVETGESLSLGGRSLQFINTPMVHWPESMFTYLPEHKLLFSMDAFGQHYASSLRFDDQVPLPTVMDEAKAYYANILMPLGRQISKTLDQVNDLEVDIVAPSHGVIWRSHVGDILSAYSDWAAFRPAAAARVVVMYDTMWESTAQMARALVQGVTNQGVEAVLLYVRQTSLTRIATEALDAGAFAIGSPTLNAGMMPMMGAVLTYLKGLRPAGDRTAVAFGSSGWGRGGPEAVHEILETFKWKMLREPIKAQYRPTKDTLAECRKVGQDLAIRVQEVAAP